ncbi:MAG: hypothetical protein HY268_23145 [Deltaproteobacteria bacterium]|nr:hypothetical protein [Deltaproteobacteria bacterium]
MSNGTSADTGAETRSWLGSVFACGNEALLTIEGGVSGIGTSVWEALHEHPYMGAVIGGGLGFGAALLLGGVAELAVTALTAYAGYRILAYGESLTEAFAKSILLRGGTSERLEEMHEEDKEQVVQEQVEKEQVEQEQLEKEQVAQAAEEKVKQEAAATAARPVRRPASKPARNRKT